MIVVSVSVYLQDFEHYRQRSVENMKMKSQLFGMDFK